MNVSKQARSAADGHGPRVLISGQNYGSNLSIARALSRAGYEVEVLRVLQQRPKFWQITGRLRPEAFSRAVSDYRVCVTEGDEHRLVEALLSYADGREPRLLIPTDDYVACAADRHYNELHACFLLPNVRGETGALERLMSKSLQKELARKAGLPVVEGLRIRVSRSPDGGAPLAELPEELGYPCFIKPDMSVYTSKGSMCRCGSERELRGAMAQALEHCPGDELVLLAEEYLEIRREYALLGVSTPEGAFVPGLISADYDGHGDQRGVAMTGRLVPLDKRKALAEAVERFVAGLGYVGLFDVDLIEDSEGRFYFTELNLRFGSSGYALTERGVNLPGLLADRLLKGKHPERPAEVREETRFLNEKVMLDEFARGYISLADVRREASRAEIRFLRDARDPGPYRHFRRFFPYALARRIYHRLKNAARRA